MGIWRRGRTCLGAEGGTAVGKSAEMEGGWGKELRNLRTPAHLSLVVPPLSLSKGTQVARRESMSRGFLCSLQR